MLFIQDQSTVPPGGWRYPGLSGHFIVVRNYQIFYDEIVKHYTANNAPVPSKEDVTLWVCQNLNLACYEGQQPFINRFTQNLPSLFSRKGCCK